MKHEELMIMPQKSRITQSSQVANTYVIKVWEDIGDPNEWTEELDIINGASEIDTVVLDICSGGGVMDTAMLFNRALRSCQAHTVAIIGPTAASAASVFALSCKEFILDETSSLMIHTSSYGIVAKDTDIFEHANFSRRQLKTLYESVYSGFLSENELSDVIKGTPFYFDANDLEVRLDSLEEYRKNLPCPCGDPLCGQSPEEGEEFDLEALIDDKVAEAIKAYDKSKLQKEAKARKLAEKKVKPVVVFEEPVKE